MRWFICWVVAVLAATLAACSSAPDDGSPERTERALDALEVQCVDLPAVADASINAAALNQNNGSKKSLQVGGKERSLVRFDLSSIPPHQVVQSAALGLYVSGGPETRLFVHRATAAWAEETVTFASFAQQYDLNPQGFVDIDRANVQKWVQLDSLVQRWLQGLDANDGVLLRSEHSRVTTLVSREGGTPAQRPVLRVCYSPIDFCAPAPCHNGGICQNNPSGFTCHCAPGWEGATCDTNIDDCASAPCQNGGTCSDDSNGFTCACAAGFTGPTCATNIDDCAGAPCQNGGVCEDGVAAYQCHCGVGYEGVNCETQTNNCAAMPCQNGGTCTNGVGTYTCTCAPGYEGVNCEIDIDDCAGSPCHNGGTCLDGVASFTCSCPADWGGPTCDVDLNSCGQTPCLNGATCTNVDDGYTCSCAPGYTGTNCEIDINDCSPNPCLVNETCIDGVNTFTCSCEAGQTCAARALAFDTLPSSVPGNSSIEVTVEAHDLNGLIVGDFAGPVTISLETSGGAIVSTETVDAIDGVATLSVAFPVTPDDYVLRATSPGLQSVVSDTIAVPAPTGPGLAFFVAPVGSVRAGDAFTLQVRALDASGTVDSSFNGNVAISAAAVGGSNFNGGTQNATAVAGIANFNVVLGNAANGYVVTATAAALASGTVSFNVTARQLAVTTVIANMQAGTPFSITLEARDANNALAENFNGNIAINAAAIGGSNFNAGTQSATAVAGSATLGGLALNDAANGYTITAQAAGLINGLSNAFNVTATHLAVLALPNVRSGDGFSVTVQARDANNGLAENFASNVALDAAAVGGSNFVGGTRNATSIAGVASFNVALNNAANGYTATATSAGVTDGVSNAFNVSARQLLVTTVVANMQAGTPFSITVEARDGNNALAENFNGSIAINAAAVGGSNFNAGTQNASAVAGSATLGGLALNDAANGYTITAQATGLINALSNAFNVTATQLAVLALPNVRSGDVFSVTVQARDANNNFAENFTSSVDLNAAAAGGSNFNGGTQNRTAVAGLANFTGVVLNNAADGYVVTATSAGLTNGVSNAFNVTARQLLVTTVIANMKAGTPFTVAIEARDANNALAENFNGNIAINAAAVGGSNFVGGTQNATAEGGTVTSGILVLNDAANGYTITAQATGPIPGVSNAFNVTATHLAVLTLPNVRSGDAFNVNVEARDANNNRAENFAGAVNVNAAAVGGSNFVGGTQNRTAVGGLATFNAVVLDNAADGYIVTATSAGLTNGVSNAFNVTAGQLLVTTVIANMQAGTPFSITIEARDANGNLAENFNSNVSLNAAAAGGSNFNGGTKNATAVAGSATLSGLILNDAANNYLITAQAAGLINGLSNTFNVTATHLAVLSVSNVRSGDAFNVNVQARDANNSVAENFTGSVSLNAAATGGSNFIGGTKNTTAAGGLATFFGLVLNDAADGYTATATSAGLTNGVSNAFNVTFRTLDVGAVANQVAGAPFNVTVTARDNNGNLAENFGAANSLALINLQAAVVANGQTAFNAPVVPSFAGGVATFTGLAISNATDGYTFSAQAVSSGVLTTDAINAAFNVTGSFVFVSDVQSSMVAGTPFTVTVELRDANGNRAENFTGSTANIVLSAAASGGSNFNGGTSVLTASLGSATFAGLALNNAADGYVVTAQLSNSSGLISGSSSPFAVTFTTLTVGPVANQVAAAPFNVTVTATDANGALAENFGPSNGLTLVNLQAAIVANGQTAFDAPVIPTFAGGIATFTGLTISNDANGYTFSAQAVSSGVLVIDAINAPFNVTP